MIKQEYKEHPLICSISGGKDSTAMILFLLENNIDFEPVFLDTGWEHELTYEYLEYLEKMVLKRPITRLRNKKYFDTEKGGYVEMVEKGLFFPSQHRRTCTLNLKVQPIQEYLTELRFKHKKKPINAVGIRRQESQARSILDEYEEKDESIIWRPLISWDKEQIIDIHRKYNVSPNPLDIKGLSRVGCFPCIFSRKKEIKHMYKVYPERFDLIRDLEKSVKEKVLSKNPDNTSVYSFFNRGLIDEVIDWSLGEQYDLFEDDEFENQGCLSWGLCDMGDQTKG